LLAQLVEQTGAWPARSPPSTSEPGAGGWR
jgi:hypothetical protein